MEKVTTVLAVYGAALATLVFVWDVIKYAKDKPKLLVKVNPHALIGPLTRESKIGIEMVNTSRRPITIVSSGFELDIPTEENIVTVLDPNLPVQLSEGQRYITYANPKEVAWEKIRCGRVRDATGKIHRSKKYLLSVVKK